MTTSLENGVSHLNIYKTTSNTSSQISLKHDYIDSPFSGKKDQFEQVLDVLDSTGFIPESLIES